jgi:hypothetical protein
VQPLTVNRDGRGTLIAGPSARDFRQLEIPVSKEIEVFARETSGFDVQENPGS